MKSWEEEQYERLQKERQEKFDQVLGNVGQNATAKIDLRSQEIDDEKIKILAETLKKNRTVREINLSSNKISAEGAKFIADALAENNLVYILDLSDNKLGNEGALILAELLKKNHTLTQVNWDRNEIGNEGMKALATAFLNNSLTEFTLVANDNDAITLNTIAIVMEAVKASSTLKKLTFHWTYSTRKFIQKILDDILSTNTSIVEVKLDSIDTALELAEEWTNVVAKNYSLLKIRADLLAQSDIQSAFPFLQRNLELCKKFHQAARDGNVELIKQYIKQGVSLLSTEEGNTVLHWAAKYGHVEVTKILIEQYLAKKLNIFVENEKGDTSLDLAKKKGHEEIVNLLASAYQPKTLSVNSLNDWLPSYKLLKILDTLRNSLEEDREEKLKFIELQDQAISDRGLEMLATGFNKAEHITINLQEESSANDFLHMFGYKINNVDCLSLNIANNNITARGAQSLCSILKNNYFLNMLDLGSNVLGDQGAEILANALSENHSLNLLTLSNNRIGNAGAKALAAAFKNCHSLNIIDLDNNQIDDEGAIFLANALTTNNILIGLALRNNRITAKGTDAFISLLENQYTLVGLPLEENNQISENQLKKLEQLLERNRKLADQMLIAAEQGDYETLTKTLQKGVTISNYYPSEVKASQYSLSALDLAVQNGHVKVVKVLLEEMLEKRIALLLLKERTLPLAKKAGNEEIIQLLNKYMENRLKLFTKRDVAVQTEDSFLSTDTSHNKEERSELLGRVSSKSTTPLSRNRARLKWNAQVKRTDNNSEESQPTKNIHNLFTKK